MATTPELAVFVFCMIGLAWTSWKLGIKHGAESAVDYLIDNGILEVEEEYD